MAQAQNENQVKPAKARPSFVRSCFWPMITMVLLWLSQEPQGLSFCSWFALVPWLVAVVRSEKYLHTATVNLCCGTIFYVTALFWLANVTMPGMLALSVVLALFFVLSGFILRRVYIASRWWFTLVLPVVWVMQEYLRATLMTGFPWLFVSHTLIDYSRITQIADITGAYGVTFLAVMVNGFIADMLLRPQVQIRQGDGKVTNLFLPRIFLLLVVFVSVYLYGSYRLNESKNTMSAGPMVTVVQESIPQRVKDSGGDSIEEIIDKHIAITKEACSGTVKPDLVVWPETMVLNAINDEFLALAADAEMFTEKFQQEIESSVQTDKTLSRLAADNKIALLIGTPAVFLGLNSDKTELEHNGRTNSALLYNPDGTRSGLRYDKMHCVPFGEYVPFKKSIPWLNKLLLSLTPYDYDYTIEPGIKPVAFRFAGPGDKEYAFTVAICYEDVTPDTARLLANWDGAHFMLNISNDGWFVNDDGRGGIVPTAELMQHLAIGRYRAIENRIGIARSVNCGISGMIKPDGSVQTSPAASTLSADDIKARRCASGYLTDNIWLDSRKTIYSRIGDSFAICCTVITVLIAIVTLKKKSCNHSQERKQ